MIEPQESELITDPALAEIWQAYVEARQTTDKSAPMDESDRVTDTCRYCVKPWQRWEGSNLDGHAACVVTDTFRVRLAELMSANPHISTVAVSKTLAVSRNTIRSWYQVGHTRILQANRNVKPRKRPKLVPTIEAWRQKPT